MVYDEGLELFMDSGENYFAFSKYTINNTVKPKDDDDEKSEGYLLSCIIDIWVIVKKPS